MCCHKSGQEIHNTMETLNIWPTGGSKCFKDLKCYWNTSTTIPYWVPIMWQAHCYLGTQDSKVSKTYTVLSETAIKKERQNLKIGRGMTNQKKNCVLPKVSHQGRAT